MKSCNRYVSDSVKYHSESTKYLPVNGIYLAFIAPKKKMAKSKMATPAPQCGYHYTHAHEG